MHGRVLPPGRAAVPGDVHASQADTEYYGTADYLHTCVNPDFRINVYQYTLGLATVGAELPVSYLPS